MEATAAVQIVNDYYEDELFRNFQIQDKLGFFNVGYWRGIESSIELAQINLIETLIEFFERRRNAKVLDVACGKGASTKYLTKYFDGKNITGINICERQLAICKLIAPECRFELMDATRLELESAQFDNILCIEAAFHFMTRHKFLQEAYRVLNDGGRLAMSDILLDQSALQISPALFSENYLPDLEAYRKDLFEIGFRHIRVEDSTEFALKPCLRAITRHMEAHFDDIDDGVQGRFYADAEKYRSIWSLCCMVYAIK